MDDAARAALSQFSESNAGIRARLESALAKLREGAEPSLVLDALEDEAERRGQVSELASAYADALNGPAVAALPNAARLNLFLKTAWLCGQQDGQEVTTLLAATQALDLAPADERALAIAEPLLLEAEEYGELANLYAAASTSAESEARARQLLERAIHMLSALPAATPAVLGLTERLARLPGLRDAEGTLLTLVERGGAEGASALVELGEGWLTEGKAREGVAKLPSTIDAVQSDAALDVLERLYDQAEEHERLEQVLRRRVSLQQTALGRGRALEKLASFQHEFQRDSAAAGTFSAAAQAYLDAAEPDDAERVCERLLDIAPDDVEAAATLLPLCATAGNFAGVAAALGVVLRGSDDNQRPTALLLGIASAAERASAAEEFAELADNVLWRLSADEREQSAQLLRESARLFTLQMRHDEAAELYRRLIADIATSEDLDAYQGLIDGHPVSEWRRHQQRWLFEWQEHHTSDRPTILLSWARFEEHELGDPEAAMSVLGRAAELAPDRPEIWENLARLRLADGDGDGGLVAANELRRLGRDVDASLLGLLLAHEPAARWAIDRVKLGLSAEQRWPELFELYDRAIAATPNDSERAAWLDEAAIAARDVAQEPGRALGYWERYSELNPTDARVDLALERLYEQAGAKSSLVRHLERRLERSDAEPRAALEQRIISLSLEVGALADAFASIERVRQTGTDTAELLERLFSRSVELSATTSSGREFTRKASEILRECYAQQARPRDVARLLRAELGLSLEAEERRELLSRLSRWCERELQDLPGAFDAERELFLSTLGERERKRLEKLGKKLGRWSELCQVHVDAAGLQAPVDSAEKRRLLARAAELATVQLKDSALAVELYRKLFEVEAGRAGELFDDLQAERGETPEAFEALCQLLDESRRFEELSKVLRKAAETRPSAALFSRLARLQAGELGDPASAIASHLAADDARAAGQVFLQQASVFQAESARTLELARRLVAVGLAEGALRVLRHQLGFYEAQYPAARKLVHLELVKTLEDSGQSEAARDELLDTAKHYPTDADVQRACAAGAVARSDWDRAEQCYRSLLLLLHGSGGQKTTLRRASIYVELAAIKLRRNEPAAATELIESGFEAALGNVPELTALAQSLVLHERWEAAERALTELRKLAQDLPTLARGLESAEERSSLLSACVSLLPLAEAEQLLRTSETELSRSDAISARLALSRRLLEQPSAESKATAVTELRAIVSHPDAPPAAWELLTRALEPESDQQALGDVLTAWLEREPHNPEALRRALRSALTRADAAGALQLSERWARAEAEPDLGKRAACLVEVAELQLDAGNPDAARAPALRAHALDPSAAEAVLLLAKLSRSEGKRAEALARLGEHLESKARRRGKLLARLLRFAADLRLENDELAEALALLTEAHQLDKTDVDTALTLGLLAIDLDRLETAASALRVLIAQRELGTREGAKARSLNLAQGYFQLARIEQHHGKKTNAKRMALRALEENPNLHPARRLLSELSLH